MPGNAREEDEPVATARPVRGRELRTMGIHGSDDPTTGEVYYEGYMDGKRYMVPDSNLEAMKDMVNFTMRRRVSLRYKHQTSYDLGEYDHFNQMLANLLSKFEGLGGSISSSPGRSEDTESSVSDAKVESSGAEEKKRKEDGMENDKDGILVPSSLEHDKEEQIKPYEKITLSNLEDDEKQQVKEDRSKDTPMSLEKRKRKTPSQLSPDKRETTDSLDYSAEKRRLTLDSMRKTPSITDEINGTIYLDSKKGRPSILDIIDLDEVKPAKTYGKVKYPKTGDRMRPVDEVADKRSSSLVEGKKTPIHPGLQERRLTQESEINKQVEPAVLKTESIDLIPTKLDTHGERLSNSAEKGPSTLDNMRKTHQSQLASEKRGIIDSNDYTADNGTMRFDNMKNKPSQLGSEKLYPVGENKEKKEIGPNITNESRIERTLMIPIKTDSKKSHFVLKSDQQPISNDESLNNDLLNGKIGNRMPIKIKIGDGEEMPQYEVADKRPSSLKEVKSAPIHPEPGENSLARENGTNKLGELYSRKTPPERDDGKEPSLPPHGNGNGFKRDRGRDEKESEDLSISSVEDTEEYRVRLLISGHFHPGETPMFIIQEYEADSGVFDDQIVDIKRIQNVGEDVNVNIAGKFYKDNIIRERDDKSLFLNIKPHTIEIDHMNSKFYYDTFEQSFKIENIVDVVLKGQFIASSLTREITPMLSFNVKKLDSGSVSFDNGMNNFTKKKQRSNITRLDQTIENKSPYNSQYLKNAVVNLARVGNTGFGKIANKVGAYSFDVMDELTISRTSLSKFGSLEVTVDDWNPNPSGLYSYLPIVPLSQHKSLTGSEMEIVEVSSEDKEITNLPQIKDRRRRKEVKQGEKPKKGANSRPTNSVDTEYICRIKDYRPPKRKCFNLF